jgi:hypothetical protein
MTYLEALSNVRKASAEFRQVTADYRALKIGEAEYLKARAAMKAVEAEYDAAYIAARNSRFLTVHAGAAPSPR